MGPVGVRRLNVVLLGLCFCLIFTGFGTTAGLQTIIFSSASNPTSQGYVEGFQANGFTRPVILILKIIVGEAR
jgi:hypothetical protein